MVDRICKLCKTEKLQSTLQSDAQIGRAGHKKVHIELENRQIV